MDVIHFVQLEFDLLRRRYSEIMAEVNDAQLNWTPPGTANAIGVNLLHAVAGEDLFIQQMIREMPTLWERQDWSKKIGLDIPPGGAEGWDEARQANLQLAPIMEFQDAVCEETTAYLNTLRPEDLDCPVNFFGSKQPLAFLLAIVVFHSHEHLGEISALIGIQAKTQE